MVRQAAKAAKARASDDDGDEYWRAKEDGYPIAYAARMIVEEFGSTLPEAQKQELFCTIIAAAEEHATNHYELMTSDI